MHRGLAVVAVLFVLVAGCTGTQPTDDGPPGTVSVPGESYTVTVTTVIDGDTVKIRFQNGTTDTVRLLGVDTPETHAENSPEEFEGVPETDAGRACLGEAGENATRFVTERLLGEEVRVNTDESADARGYYGRLLGYITHDGQNLNYQLVATGHARVYDSEFALSEQFYAAEERAQTNRTAAWACRSPRAIADGGSGLIASVHADAAGDDRENLNDEYVVLAHDGSTSLDIGNWTVSDEAGATYTVPTGTTLDAGAEIRLHTGAGTDSATDLYWDYSRPVWNNAGDTVTVRAANGSVVADYSYD